MLDVMPGGAPGRKIGGAAVLKAVDREARTIEFVLSDETVDRDGDIIRAAGWQLESFLKNAPLLAFHDPRQPIGSWEDVRVEGTRLIGRAKFAAAGTVPLADQLFSLYADGHLKAVSVGFEIIEAIPLIVDDVRRGFEILKAGLLEASLVTIPSNPNALQRMQSKMAKAYKDGDEANAAALARIVKAADEVAGDSEGDEKADDGEKAEKAEAGDSFTTSSEEGHSHEFTVGSATTELAGDPPHVHALTDPGGEQPLVIEEAEGHTHTAPDAAFVTLEEDEEAGAEADDERGKAMETAQRLFREIGERQTELGDIMARLEGKQPGDGAAVEAVSDDFDAAAAGVRVAVAHAQALAKDRSDEIAAAIEKESASGDAATEKLIGAAALRDLAKHWPEIAALAGDDDTGRTLLRALINAEKDRVAAERKKLSGKTYEIVREKEPVEQSAQPFDATAFAAALTEKLGGAMGDAVEKCLRRPAGRV